MSAWLQSKPQAWLDALPYSTRIQSIPLILLDKLLYFHQKDYFDRTWNVALPSDKFDGLFVLVHLVTRIWLVGFSIFGQAFAMIILRYDYSITFWYTNNTYNNNKTYQFTFSNSTSTLYHIRSEGSIRRTCLEATWNPFTDPKLLFKRHQ